MADELSERRRVRSSGAPRTPIQVANLTIEGLSLKHADVLVVYDADAGDETMIMVLEQLHLVTGLMVIALSPGVTIQTLDVDQMREAGWVRAEQEGAQDEGL